MKKRDPIAEYVLDWVRWCQTRSFYAPAPTKSLLARMQPAKTGSEPNARNHPDMQYFNMAVHTLADMKQWRREWPTFKAHFLGAGQVVKVTASQLGIGTRTYYDHITRFSRAAYVMAEHIKKAHEALQPTPGQPPAATPVTAPHARGEHGRLR